MNVQIINKILIKMSAQAFMLTLLLMFIFMYNL